MKKKKLIPLPYKPIIVHYQGHSFSLDECLNVDAELENIRSEKKDGEYLTPSNTQKQLDFSHLTDKQLKLIYEKMLFDIAEEVTTLEYEYKRAFLTLKEELEKRNLLTYI